MNNNKQMEMPFGAVIDDDGIWCQVLNRSTATSLRPALFLDRDGVVVEEAHYLHRVHDVQLIPGAADIISKANAIGIAVVIVTNQAGIGYGKYDWPEFALVQERMLDDLDERGAFVNAVFACPFHERGKPPYDVPDHPCRKPNPGMLMKASARLPIDLNRSWIVGDRAGDLAAGLNAGLRGGLHVKTGHGVEEKEQVSAAQLQCDGFSVYSRDSIADVLDCLPILSDAALKM